MRGQEDKVRETSHREGLENGHDDNNDKTKHDLAVMEYGKLRTHPQQKARVLGHAYPVKIGIMRTAKCVDNPWELLNMEYLESKMVKLDNRKFCYGEHSNSKVKGLTP